jgi:hypothetical protein
MASRAGLSRDEFYRLTLREVFLYCAVQIERDRAAFELATAQAYQTVRIWAMTKSKKRLPRFADVLNGGGDHRIDAHTSPAKARAMLEMLAAKTGGKVRSVKR